MSDWAKILAFKGHPRLFASVPWQDPDCNTLDKDHSRAADFHRFPILCVDSPMLVAEQAQPSKLTIFEPDLLLSPLRAQKRIDCEPLGSES